MRAILKFFFLSLGAALAVSWLANNPGEATFAWLGYEARTGIAFLFAVLGLLVAILWFLLSFFRIFYRRISSAGRAHHS